MNNKLSVDLPESSLHTRTLERSGTGIIACQNSETTKRRIRIFGNKMERLMIEEAIIAATESRQPAAPSVFQEIHYLCIPQ